MVRGRPTPPRSPPTHRPPARRAPDPQSRVRSAGFDGCRELRPDPADVRRRDARSSRGAAPTGDPLRVFEGFFISDTLAVDGSGEDVPEVVLAGKQVDLTAREFDLLDHFARHPGRVFRRADLLDKVWGYGHEGYEHTVNSHINRLRAKIENDPSDPKRIVTVWGVGYKFSAEAKSAAA